MKKKITTSQESCFWVWFSSPINGEAYQSVLTTSAGEALKAAGRLKKAVTRVFNCRTFENHEVVNGVLV